MLLGNQMANALVGAGIAEPLKPKRPRKGKSFKCHKCNTEMVKPENTNVMYCPSCDSSYFIFSDRKDN